MEYKHLESHGNRNRDCDCPLSRTSYPHWPPTSLKEAFDQLYLLQDQHNRHRRYLAHQWWAFVRSQASIRPVYERDVDTADILALCPCIQVDLDKDLSATERPAGWRCHNYCRIVMESRNRDGCLCFCRNHIDDRPIVLLMVHSELSGTYRLYGFHYKDTLNGYDLVIVYLLFN